MKYLPLCCLLLLLVGNVLASTFPQHLFEVYTDSYRQPLSILKEDVKPISTVATELAMKPTIDEHRHKNHDEKHHHLRQKSEKLKKINKHQDQQKGVQKYNALLQILEKALKHKYLQGNLLKTRISITEATYQVEYYHSLLPSDKVVISNDHLVTAQRGSNKMFVKRHNEGTGVSMYETLQDKASGKWVHASKDGNNLVDEETEATWFQVFGVGNMFVFQYFNPHDIINSYQFGADNGPLGTQLKISSSQTELFKLIPA